MRTAEVKMDFQDAGRSYRVGQIITITEEQYQRYIRQGWIGPTGPGN